MFPRWKFHNVKIKCIFSEIKTWFQGEISECKNKKGFSQKLKHGSKVKFKNIKIKWFSPQKKGSK
jgi:hypothetical protein